jgi:DNA-binding response OmpR family regulator
VVVLVIVDDDEAIARGYDRVLTLNGLNVIIAHDRAGCLRGVSLRRPDVVLVDVGESMADAITCVRNLRARQSLRGTPIGIITADCPVSREGAALKALRARLFYKPSSLSHVVEIARSLARHAT